MSFLRTQIVCIAPNVHTFVLFDVPLHLHCGNFVSSWNRVGWRLTVQINGDLHRDFTALGYKWVVADHHPL